MLDQSVKSFFDGRSTLTAESMPKAATGAAGVLRRRLLEHLKRYRSRRHMAEMIGIAPETLTRWLTSGGVPNPRLSELEQFAEALGLPFVALLSEGEGEEGNVSRGDVELVMSRVAAELRPKLTAELRGVLADELRKVLDEWAKRG